MVAPYVPNPADWPHQSYAVTEAVNQSNEGWRRFCITSPTGGGKSRIIQRLCEHWAKHGKTSVVMSNRRLLTEQLLQGLHRSGIDVGCRAAGYESWTNPSALAQVISAQTESSRVFNRREKHGIDAQLHPGDLLIVDEAHIQKGAEAQKIINEYASLHDAFVVGISATPLGIGGIYTDGLIVAGNNTQLRECGALVWANRYEPAIMDLGKIYKKKTGIISQSIADKAARTIWTQVVVANILGSWKKLNPDARPSIGMAPGVRESRGLAQEYWNHGINAAHIDSGGIYVNGSYKNTTEQTDRDELFEMLKDGTVKQIWNRFVLREGIDLPYLYCLQLATPIASLTAYLQTCGRVLRSHPSKKLARIIDHAGNIHNHGNPNHDRDTDWRQYFFEEDETKITKDRRERQQNPSNKEKSEITCPNCGAMRPTGPKCPGCGFEHAQSVRKIIQEDGTLRLSKGDVYKKRRTKMTSTTEKQWDSVYWRCKKSSMTFSQARGLFYKQHGYHPPDGLPNMPINSGDWSRKISAVSYADLHKRKVGE